MLRVVDLQREYPAWAAALSALPDRLRDVYFGAPYHLLWQRNGDGAARGAVFESDLGTVLYPFLLRPLEPLLGAGWEGFHDISSAYGYGGPLVAPRGNGVDRRAAADDAAELGRSPHAALVAAFRCELAAWCRSQGVISEFVRFHPLLENEVDMAASVDGAPAMDVVPANVTVWCRLSSPDEHRARLSSSTRRNLRKAERNGLTFAAEDDNEAWSRFIELYHATMRRRDAGDYYLFPGRYFDDCRELLGDAASILCVRRPGAGGARGEVVAAALFLRGGDGIHYHLGGSDPAALAERPNNLLFVGAMDWGAALGARTMHLGGGVQSGGDDELFRFKAGFSPLRARLHLGRCVHDADAYIRATELRRREDGGETDAFFPAYRAPTP